MTDLPFLRDLGLILAAAAGMGLVARAARVPLIVAYMVAGLLLGPASGLVGGTGALELIAEIGIALLLFLVGLELSLSRIRDVGRVAVLAGAAQIGITGAAGWLLGLALGFAPLPAALLALALTFSSTVVVVKVLEQRGALAAVHGRIAVGILLVQDVAVAISLTLLAGTDPAGLGARELGRGLLQASVAMTALIGTAFLAVRFVLPPLLRWLGRSLEGLFVWSLTWCFGFLLAARGLGLSVEIGAFVAGVGLAQIDYNHELIRRVRPLADFFLAVFFVTLGIHMEFGAVLSRWPAVLALTAFVLVGKPAILMALIPRFGYGERTSFLASLTLGQISEFSFVVAGLAAAAGLAGADFVSVVALLGLVTMGASATLIGVGDRLYAWLAGKGWLRPFGARAGVEAEATSRLHGHVIVVGMNTLGLRLVEGFSARGDTVLAVDVDPAKLKGLPCATLQGSTDHVSVLAEARLADAKLLVSALQIEDANNLLAYRARRAGVPSSIHAFDLALADELRQHGATHVMLSKFDGIRQIAVALRQAGVMD